VLAGYPDRVAQRREPLSPRVRLASGAGAVVGRESGVAEGEFLVALDVHTTATDPRIRVASRVEREWLLPSATEIVHRFDREAGVVRALEIDRYDALILAERPTKADPDVAATLLAEAWLERGPRGDDDRLLNRLRFADESIDLRTLVHAAARKAQSLDDVNLAGVLPPELARALDRDAPVALRVPSGRLVPLEYRDDGSVAAAVKLQELFGLADTPRIGKTRVAVLFALLAPNGRAVQLTRDLRSFWENTYPEVRKELRGRYPKHPWPENPWNATPTPRITKAKGQR
jgi:ATP-dependent helicase HrpB